MNSNQNTRKTYRREPVNQQQNNNNYYYEYNPMPCYPNMPMQYYPTMPMHYVPGPVFYSQPMQYYYPQNYVQNMSYVQRNTSYYDENNYQDEYIQVPSENLNSFDNYVRQIPDENGINLIGVYPLNLVPNQNSYNGYHVFVSFEILYTEDGYHVTKFTSVPLIQTINGEYNNNSKELQETNVESSKKIPTEDGVFTKIEPKSDEVLTETKETSFESISNKCEIVQKETSNDAEIDQKITYSEIVKNDIDKANLIKNMINITSRESSPKNETQNDQSFDNLKDIKLYLSELDMDDISDLSFHEENNSNNAVALLHSIAMSYVWGYIALPNCFMPKHTDDNFVFIYKKYKEFKGDNGLYFHSKDIYKNYFNILMDIKNKLVPIFDNLLNEDIDDESFVKFFITKNNYIIKYFHKIIFNNFTNDPIDLDDVVNKFKNSMKNVDSFKKMLFKIVILFNSKIEMNTMAPNKLK